MKDKWEFYKDAENKWRWRRTAPNGNIVGASTEGYVNKTACKGNARRNGWRGIILFRTKEEYSVQNTVNEEYKEINDKAYQLFKENGIKESNDYVLWLQAERELGERFSAKRYKKLRNILFLVTGLLCGIVAMLLIVLFKNNPPVVLSEKSLSELKVMMLVLDPKEDEKIVVFGDTHFEFGESDLSINAKALLNKNIQSLRENPDIDVRMAGYTSAKGTEEVNQKLSEERANTVRNYLIEQGIAPERITVIGYGRTRPALFEVSPLDRHSKEALANMRVLFEVVVK